MWRIVWTVRPAMPTSGAVKAREVVALELASVSTPIDSHQRVPRSALVGQSMRTSEHSDEVFWRTQTAEERSNEGERGEAQGGGGHRTA